MADPENHIDRILGESKECLTAWKQLYKAAVLETNMDLVPRRVQEARKAAGERAMHLIREPADDGITRLGICKSGFGRIEQKVSVR
jgi:hypothetical protein